MSGRPPSFKPLDHRHPLTLAMLLDWYGAVLEEPSVAGAPTLTMSSWHQRQDSGLAPSAWHVCEQCNEGQTKRGPCVNCAGRGGWSVDPYDSQHKRIADTSTDSVRAMTAAEYDRALRSADREGTLPELDRAAHPAVRRVPKALHAMRKVSASQRSVLVCEHVLRLPGVAQHDPLLYEAALETFGRSLTKYQAPKWLRYAARARFERRRPQNVAA